MLSKLVPGTLVLLILALAILVGRALSPDAMAVVVGVVCGIGASIPTSLLMLYVLSRRETPAQPTQQPAPPTAPLVMIVNPQAAYSPQQPYWNQQLSQPYFPTQRQPQMLPDGRSIYDPAPYDYRDEEY